MTKRRSKYECAIREIQAYVAKKYHGGALHGLSEEYGDGDKIGWNNCAESIEAILAEHGIKPKGVKK